MVDLANTLIVVQHHEETMFAAHYLLEIRPKARLERGEIVASGPLEEFIESKDSITAKYLSGKESIEIPKSRRSGNGKVISILGGSEN
ncbi:hypothetical protein ACJOMK_06340, partial [Mycoplasmopsis synoviae]